MLLQGIGPWELVIIAGVLAVLAAPVVGAVIFLLVMKRSTKAAATCPGCGAPNPPGSRSCCRCGRNLGDG